MSDERYARTLHKFDLYPNRGIDHPFQPRTYRGINATFDPVPCRHGEPWTKCITCSPRGRR